ncbi:MAG: cupin domain-containing protein [Cardiobacteriaceae bacterium]|nr:cupin domain-containing protein [Cardiobacteriaceae bacterium]
MMNKAYQEQAIFPIGDLNVDYKDFFIGDSYLAMLAASPDKQVNVANVTFELGCRNNWHCHENGYQILLVTAGEGFFQEEGKPAQRLKAGDVIVIKESVKHWHGATKDSWFTHIAITAGNAIWFEGVSQQEYDEVNSVDV